MRTKETKHIVLHVRNVQVAKLSQRDRAAGCVSFDQEWKTWTGRQYITDIIRLSSTTVIWSACKAIEIGAKTQIIGYYAVQGHSRNRGRHQSKARIRFPISD